MRKFIFKVIAYLAVFAAGVTVISVIAIQLFGDVISRNILNGFVLAMIVVVAGSFGGKLGNEYKDLRNGKQRPEEE